VLVLLSGAPLVHAATGGINSVHKYAWSNVGGWINFAPANSTVTVGDSGLTGYAWSANDGWINLAPLNRGVKNDGAGKLSGFAWDSSAGWVSFTGVTIDSSGFFHGTATGGTVNGASYAISFDCTSCEVITAWRPTVTSSGAISPVGAGSLVQSTVLPSASPSAVGPSIQPPALPSASSTAAPPNSVVMQPGAPGEKGGPAAVTSSGTNLGPGGLANSVAHASSSALTTPTHQKSSAPVSNLLRSLGILAGAAVVVLLIFLVFRFFL